MIEGKKVVVCLPAYNAARTLEKTYHEISKDLVDAVILVDDGSIDETVSIANALAIQYVIVHTSNKGYGANQKTCYAKALGIGADIIIMLHPDYQYNPKLIPSMAYLIANDVYPVVLGSRILGNGAMHNGMPVYKYFANRVLTFIQNILLRQKLSEYHTGYRAYSRAVLMSINLNANSDDFIFDNQLLAQVFFKGFEIGEISCPARYFAEASSINFKRSVRYGLGVIYTSVQYRLAKWAIIKPAIFK
ncbi:glycosyltransferase family 2 protein [Segetibacter sp. 3557_3]|uniref:glycosyltransferase family 2 protein n=1 Tax=Segetibacter sp. 3557_3 TaxID=2547429 RepID=UPI0010584339|nr:glycosyltransferase family 2 protein [Segetibacter sp. 3557_3]TDH17931.1 glycosyltransferase family 2 protein [Segetibacter sp. 3557_3]